MHFIPLIANADETPISVSTVALSTLRYFTLINNYAMKSITRTVALLITKCLCICCTYTSLYLYIHTFIGTYIYNYKSMYVYDIKPHALCTLLYVCSFMYICGPAHKIWPLFGILNSITLFLIIAYQQHLCYKYHKQWEI